MFKQLASDFHLDLDFPKVEGLPEYTHVYGNTQLPPESPHWMTYAKPRDTSWGMPDGDISFTRLTKQAFPEFTSAVVGKLQRLFGDVIEWNEDRVHIIRTTGFILPHKDEARNTVINIGLKNSSSAVTKFGKSGNLGDFRTGNTYDYVCEDGGVYLLDVTQYHAVFPMDATPRYLITYGFAARYDKLLRDLSH